MQRNLKFFIKIFLVFAIIGCTVDFLFNGFQVVISEVISELIMDLLLASITVYICGEVERKMDGN